MGNKLEVKVGLSSKFEHYLLKHIYFYFLMKWNHYKGSQKSTLKSCMLLWKGQAEASYGEAVMQLLKKAHHDATLRPVNHDKSNFVSSGASFDRLDISLLLFIPFSCTIIASCCLSQTVLQALLQGDKVFLIYCFNTMNFRSWVCHACDCLTVEVL